MAQITTRQTAGTGATVAGVPLTNAQIDQNFINLNVDVIGHKYHSFSNDQYFFDDYEQGRYFRLFTENAVSDNTRFGAIQDVEYWNGTAWVVWSDVGSLIKNLLDGRQDTYCSIDHVHRRFRFTVTKNSGWPTKTIIALQTTWTGFTYTSATVTIEGSTQVSGGTWTTRDTSVFGNATSGANWGIHAKVTSSLHTGEIYNRITIDITDWVDSGIYTTYPLVGFAVYSNYTGASLQPWSWNYDKVVNFQAVPTALGNLVLTSANYNSYSPTLTGTGASGTWGINILGNAGSATVATSLVNNSVTDYLRVTNTAGAQRLLMGNQDSGGVNNPSMIIAANGELQLGNGNSWTGSGGTFTRHSTFNTTGGYITGQLKVGSNTTSSSYKFDVTNTLAGAQADKTIVHIADLYNAGANGQFFKIMGGLSGINLLSGWGNLVLGARTADGNDTFTSHLVINGAGTVNIPNTLQQGGNQVLHAGNYNSYSPTLTGTGASGTWAIGISGNAATVTNGVYTTGSYADPAWITSLAKSKVGLGNVENTAISTWAGSTNITTVGAITTTSVTSSGGITTSSATHRVQLGTDAGGSISIGRIDNVASAPYIDFNSGATSTDFDVRLASSGGNGTAGNGLLTITGNVNIAKNLTVVGTVQHAGLTMTAGTNVDQVYSVTDTLTLTTAWQDTTVNAAELATGTYVVQVLVNDNAVNGGHWSTYYSGVMSWYAADTNEASSDEIMLHRAGHASTTGNLYLRVLRTLTADVADLKLQIAGSTTNTGTSTYQFKFRRLI